MVLQIESSTPVKTEVQTQNSNRTDSTPVVNIPLVKKQCQMGDTLITKTIPKEIDKQLDIIYKTGVADLKNMPFWLKALGGNKATKDFSKIVENKDFKKDMDDIFEKARTKNNAPDKDVLELIKKPEVLDKVFECLKNHSQKGTLVHWLLCRDTVKENFAKNIAKNQHRYLLYGE